MISGLRKWLASSRFSTLFYILFSLFVVVVIVVIACLLLINRNQLHVLQTPEQVQQKLTDPGRVALVLGGGIGENNQPIDVVVSRLDAAVTLYENGAIDSFLVSGDNRFINYNEPQVMQDYLVEKRGIPVDKIQQDNAGRSTYESCHRAKQVFGLNKVILVSQQSHLPRAIYLCRSFGIEAYGFASSNDHTRLSQAIRELAANVKAVYNVYVRGEPTILGEPIPLQAP